MSSIGSMATAISGLEAHGQQLSVVSDNIVNANTIGFKSSRGEFKSVLADALGHGGETQIGRGTRLGAVTSLFTQGSIQKTEADADLKAVRRLFELLLKFTQEDAPGFQLIVTEHANLRDQWFQDALVERPWTKPPALVPEDWNQG